MHSFFQALFLTIPTLLCATPPPANSGDALNQLINGNGRYVSGNSLHPSLLNESKNYTAESQDPFAVIVGCSDSRVPPEIIFDQGIGDLFVVRVAGNVIGPIEMDSVEFAVAKLHTPIVIVMGHQNCSAVKATLVGKENVPELDCIYPLIETAFENCAKKAQASAKNAPADKIPLDKAIKCNVVQGVETLKKSPTIAPLIAEKKVQIVGAYYEIATGKISIITE
ncbi:MAG: carbonic anhydrase [Chlamydiota bacterium]